MNRQQLSVLVAVGVSVTIVGLMLSTPRPQTYALEIKVMAAPDDETIDTTGVVGVYFDTIEYYGRVKSHLIFPRDYIIPIKPIIRRVSGEPLYEYEAFGVICDNYTIPYGHPISSISIKLCEGQNDTQQLCFYTSAEYIEVGVGGKSKSTKFSKEECKKVILERDGGLHINLSFRKRTCFNMTSGGLS